MLEIITTLLGGGLTGLFGSVITAFSNYKMQKIKNEHEIAIITAESNAIVVESQAQIVVQKAKIEEEIQVAEVEALKESYKDQSTTLFDKSYMQSLMGSKWFSWIGAIIAFMFGLVDFMKQACRPVLTYYLVGASTWITVIAYKLLQEAMGQTPLALDKAYDIFNQVTYLILYLTVSCVTWWFCDRRMAKFAMRLEDGNLKTTR